MRQGQLDSGGDVAMLRAAFNAHHSDHLQELELDGRCYSHDREVVRRRIVHELAHAQTTEQTSTRSPT